MEAARKCANAAPPSLLVRLVQVQQLVLLLTTARQTVRHGWLPRQHLTTQDITSASDHTRHHVSI
jgi:hypothetical protein